MSQMHSEEYSAKVGQFIETSIKNCLELNKKTVNKSRFDFVPPKKSAENSALVPIYLEQTGLFVITIRKENGDIIHQEKLFISNQ